MSTPDKPIRIKLISKVSENEWLRQFPDNQPLWGNCEFTFDRDATEYDWFVVYNDLPASQGERFSVSKELLRCPKEHTLLITTEPSSIKHYGTYFTAQFGHVLTSQERWALPHRHRIYSQPALHWFYGLGKEKKIPFNAMRNNEKRHKKKIISTVCSNKKQKHTLHNQRYLFTQNIKELIPELDIYGHGVKDMDDKAEALDDYKYHIAIENHIGPHHWTEKLADAYLGLTLPFYHGCPNVTDYFPADSFIPIDINDLEESFHIIRKAIDNNEYEKRLPAIIEARRRVLEQYNIFAVLCKKITELSTVPVKETRPKVIYSRHALRKKHPLIAMADAFSKLKARLTHRYQS